MTCFTTGPLFVRGAQLAVDQNGIFDCNRTIMPGAVADDLYAAAVLVMRHGTAAARNLIGSCNSSLRAEMKILQREHARRWKMDPVVGSVHMAGEVVGGGAHKRYHLAHHELEPLDLGDERFYTSALEEAALRKYGTASEVMSRKERDRRERLERLEDWIRQCGAGEPQGQEERKAWAVACRAYVDHGLGRVQRIPDRYQCWLAYERLSDLDRLLVVLKMPMESAANDESAPKRGCTVTPPSPECMASVIQARKGRYLWAISHSAMVFATASNGQIVDYILSGKNRNVIVAQIEWEKSLRAELDRIGCNDLFSASSTESSTECLMFVLFGNDIGAREFALGMKNEHS
jgi:hypothetical protein